MRGTKAATNNSNSLAKFKEHNDSGNGKVIIILVLNTHTLLKYFKILNTWHSVRSCDGFIKDSDGQDGFDWRTPGTRDENLVLLSCSEVQIGSCVQVDCCGCAIKTIINVLVLTRILHDKFS